MNIVPKLIKKWLLKRRLRKKIIELSQQLDEGIESHAELLLHCMVFREKECEKIESEIRAGNQIIKDKMMRLARALKRIAKWDQDQKKINK